MSFNPLQTGHKFNVHKTLKNPPGRLMNILYVFNLRPVSRIKHLKNNSTPNIFYEKPF